MKRAYILIMYLCLAGLQILCSCKGSTDSDTDEGISVSDKTDDDKEDEGQFVPDVSALLVVETFIEALGSEDYRKAYQQTNGKLWGGYDKFSKPTAFGGINKTEILSIERRPDKNDLAQVYVHARFYDPANKDLEIEEIFSLEIIDGEWRICKVKVNNVEELSRSDAFVGKWSWSVEKNGFKSSFDLQIKVVGNKISGGYTATALNGNRIDGMEAYECPIEGELKGNKAIVSYTSCYSGHTGEAEIKVIDENHLQWEITDPAQDAFAPMKANLVRK